MSAQAKSNKANCVHPLCTADVDICTPRTGGAGLKVSIGINPGYNHLYSLILHGGHCSSHGGHIDCDPKGEIYGFYTVSGSLPGAKRRRWIALPSRPIIQPLLASSFAHLIGQREGNR